MHIKTVGVFCCLVRMILQCVNELETRMTSFISGVPAKKPWQRCWKAWSIGNYIKVAHTCQSWRRTPSSSPSVVVVNVNHVMRKTREWIYAIRTVELHIFALYIVISFVNMEYFCSLRPTLFLNITCISLCQQSIHHWFRPTFRLYLFPCHNFKWSPYLSPRT